MRKIILELAALATVGIALPYAAPAKAEETVIVKHRHHEWHPHHHKTVIIKHEHHEHEHHD